MLLLSFFFFFNDTATTEIYTLSLHDALPISARESSASETLPAFPPPCKRLLGGPRPRSGARSARRQAPSAFRARSEEHTSELQLRQYLVCRLLLEKKKTIDDLDYHEILDCNV